MSGSFKSEQPLIWTLICLYLSISDKLNALYSDISSVCGHYLSKGNNNISVVTYEKRKKRENMQNNAETSPCISYFKIAFYFHDIQVTWLKNSC